MVAEFTLPDLLVVFFDILTVVVENCLAFFTIERISSGDF